ncbi:hypothetical protein EJ03DRAFT_66474 [Teratosphaeria nubilosa]|uniref:MIT domain-containing protein n=1 Tax=Teratosphaeria nubilosa TaxID=161662 RepID=A0A6G1LBY9_9PEZI|nr:hypothetical protein EJ03DRAFT_66474 [Teratosphaeria nubilosa]
MMHGTAVAVSATSNSGAGAPAAAIGSAVQKQRPRPSRSESLSSSSVVTVRRTGSLSSSSTGTRNSVVPMRSQSPAEPSLIALRLGRDHVSPDHKRRRSVAVEPASIHVDSEGLDTLNRWSHSTSSSVNSIANTRRSRASSGAALQPPTGQLFSPQRRNRSGLGQSPQTSPQRKPDDSRPSSQRRSGSPVSDTNGYRTFSQSEQFTKSLTALPSLRTTPALTAPDDTESPATIQDLQTPSTISSYYHSFGHDYFGGDDGASPRSQAPNQKPILMRNYTAPMSSLSQARTGGHDIHPREILRRPNTSEVREIGSGAAELSGGRNHGHRRSRTREGREKDKKAMLSKALQKANTAVLLDNAQNFEGALEAYSDACRLLQQVMDRSSGFDDKRKLETIRVTYTNRIEELRQLELSRPSTADDKDLPARPMSDDSSCLSPVNIASSPVASPIDAMVGAAATAGFAETPTLPYSSKDRDSCFARTMEAVEERSRGDGGPRSESPEERHHQDDPTTGAVREDRPQYLHLDLSPSNHQHMPAPLSPRRPLSPQRKSETDDACAHEPELVHSATHLVERGHAEGNDSSVSWLDTIDEYGSDSASVHSLSRNGLRRKHLRNLSNATDPDFDAAFDAAVEAAYNEGLEPDTEARQERNAAYRHAQKDSFALPSSDIEEVLSHAEAFQLGRPLDLDMSDEEEERLLDDITQDYSQSFNFDLSSKSALPRQSDSSGHSRSTWQSSQASVDRTTAATSLSTVEEDAFSARDSQLADSAPMTFTAQPPPSAPPLTALPPPPPLRSSGVRSRRMSGANTKQLKIETTATRPEARKRASTFHHSPSPRFEDEEKKEALDKNFRFGANAQPSQSDLQHDHFLTSPPPLEMRSAVYHTRPPTVKSAEKRRSLDDRVGDLLSPRPELFRKNKSSASLREHTVLLASPDIDTIPSAITPMSSTFMAYNYSLKKLQDPLTSQRAKFPSFDAGYNNVLSSGGAYLFDTSLSAAQLPTSPKLFIEGQPVAMEPCPESFLLRPFWLMRALSNTLTHPKGGFLTTKLFVPREVWHTRAVKLKALEDKVANCDLLTAALGRLAGVDTYDADAVMEELQSFEEVMERVQVALSKKLGSDVGLHGIGGMFKDAPAGTAPAGNLHQSADAVAGAERTAKGKEGKGYLNSWRKLRNKSSATPLSTGQHTLKADKDVQTMASVPMTSFVPIERRGTKKGVRNMAFDGPQKEYMGSLARLFDAVQVLDQIARQVEDPGLKHSSPTHVGLELSIRHAAEFFGFYITRFVLADLGVLLDKFVKRGTEWVLA